MKVVIVFLLVISASGWPVSNASEEPWEPPPVDRSIEPEKSEVPKETTVLGFVIDTAISAYQFFLSDQQGDVCAFAPSCSQYAQQAIDSCGLILGAIMTADRLQRCNWFTWSYAPRYYRPVLENEKLRLSDPVSNNSPRGSEQRCGLP
ncbi:membrane protein insertion efficiency factor YidD [candidate division TA06 bacterium]|uniref:Membrane protein insertion efficiency factor YidD n=1 Tax=candidate division TA06 bacterium TaxID=2250710 RepID=A0A523UU05_UNCT6|nr:MAG: membrane protein insertion efficiency factor YidD [candidate division TA06 bacterium]